MAAKQDTNRNEPREIARVTIKFTYNKVIGKRDGKEIKIDNFRCNLRKSTAVKIGIEPVGSIYKKGNKIIRARGSSGAKHYTLKYKSKDKSGYDSYSLPVPSWLNLADFVAAIWPKIKNQPEVVVTPHGIHLSKEALLEIKEDNIQDAK